MLDTISDEPICRTNTIVNSKLFNLTSGIMQNLLFVLYFSVATREFSSEEISSLLRTSRLHNLANDVSGVLYYRDGYFIQALEGPKNEVIRTYARILDDPRHKDCTLISINTTPQWSFEGCPMGWVNLDDSPVELIGAIRYSLSNNRGGVASVVMDWLKIHIQDHPNTMY